jgi:hypothetical protein
MGRSNMAVTLHDGHEIEVGDLWFITHKMYSDFVGNKLTEKAEAELMAKATGLDVDAIIALPEKDYRKIAVAIVRAVVTPDPI